MMDTALTNPFSWQAGYVNKLKKERESETRQFQIQILLWRAVWRKGKRKYYYLTSDQTYGIFISISAMQEKNCKQKKS